MFFADTYIEEYSGKPFPNIHEVTEYIVNKIVFLQRSMMTAVSDRERAEINASLSVCSAALSLLNIAYISEDNQFFENVKTLMREIPG